jgi:hypothetical protein
MNYHTPMNPEILNATAQGDVTVIPSCPVPELGGIKCVAVVNLSTKKIIALCGPTDAPDMKESIANAIRIAIDWNERNVK